MLVPAPTALLSTLAGLLLPLTAFGQGIPWTTSLDGALAEARQRGTIVMIAIQMPGERGSDEMLERHYRDASIVRISNETVNLLLEVEPGRAPADEATVRERYLKVAPDALVAAPHHLFVAPGADGAPDELLSSFAYQVTIGQLEWAWADAIRKVRPDFAWMPSDRARAPESLLYGTAETEGIAPPPTREDVRLAIKALRSGTRDPARMFESYRTVLSSAEKEAIKFGTVEMRNLSAFLKRPAMRLVADVSPDEWHVLAEEYLEDNDARVRTEAARALEKLRSPKSVRVLRRLLRKEKDDDCRGRMLRAMAACGPDDRAVVRELEKVLRKDDVVGVRVQATAAAIDLEDPATVRELIELALADQDPTVRSAAAYAVAARRDTDLAQIVDAALEAETNTEVSGWLATTQEVLAGGDLRKFKPFVEKALADRKPGDGARQFSQKVDDWIDRMRGGGDKAADDPKPPKRGSSDAARPAE